MAKKFHNIVPSLTDKKSSDDDESTETGSNRIYYRIRNRFWYYLFLFGSQLGDETYYAIFFSFWFWNIDGAVGRRVILVWNLVMYIGEIQYLNEWGTVGRGVASGTGRPEFESSRRQFLYPTI